MEFKARFELLNSQNKLRTPGYQPSAEGFIICESVATVAGGVFFAGYLSHKFSNLSKMQQANREEHRNMSFPHILFVLRSSNVPVRLANPRPASETDI